MSRSRCVASIIGEPMIRHTTALFAPMASASRWSGSGDEIAATPGTMLWGRLSGVTLSAVTLNVINPEPGDCTGRDPAV